MNPESPERAAATAGPSRRRFLLRIGGVASCAAFAPMLQGCEVTQVHGAGGGTFDFDVADPAFAALATVNGAVFVDADAIHPLVLIRTSDTEVTALSRICTHEQCDMSPPVGSWDASTQKLRCLCHGSIFDTKGAVLKGPAQLALQRYPVTFADGKGTVEL